MDSPGKVQEKVIWKGKNRVKLQSMRPIFRDGRDDIAKQLKARLGPPAMSITFDRYMGLTVDLVTRKRVRPELVPHIEQEARYVG